MKELIEVLREKYPKGAVVKLDYMSDPFADDMVSGLLGVVEEVDDIGTVHVSWENGRNLGVVLGEDFCHVIALPIETDPDKALKKLQDRLEEEPELHEKLGETVLNFIECDDNYTFDIGSNLKDAIQHCKNGRDYRIVDNTVASICGMNLEGIMEKIDERDKNAYEWMYK